MTAWVDALDVLAACIPLAARVDGLLADVLADNPVHAGRIGSHALSGLRENYSRDATVSKPIRRTSSSG